MTSHGPSTAAPTTDATVHGQSWIAGASRAENAAGTFHAENPRTGEPIAPAIRCASTSMVDEACRAAFAAFESFGDVEAVENRVRLLQTIASELDLIRAPLIDRAEQETGLVAPRLGREFDRMTFTFREMARVIHEGSWVRAAIDHPAKEAAPGTIPAHDVRRLLIPIGPVAVFGASNFPLAYGVAGGDTASALAAGCPVVVKGHPSHPGTGELVAQVIAKSVARTGVHAGVFSYLHSGGSNEMEVGRALVAHDAIAGVGFTGSFGGGMALVKAANERHEPIPVFAEMGSANPVFLLPGAVAGRADEISEKLAASALDSSGQQCTCPGILFLVAGPAASKVIDGLARHLDEGRTNVMLSRRVREGYRRRLRECLAVSGVTSPDVLTGFARDPEPKSGPVTAPAGLLRTTFATFRAQKTLHEEIFGPAMLIVECASEAELLEASSLILGSLTGTIWHDAADALAPRITRALARKAGRVVFNGVPPGVRVVSSMIHGGPYPSTNRPDSTAAGAFAIDRWTRPVCYQNAPSDLLPSCLREGNTAQDGGIRLIDGRWTGMAT